MFVDELGLDPAKVETSCVLRKLILKMQDGVPYDNFRHALRAEHDWAIVAETLYYGCCCRSRSSAAPPCCTAPANHKLSSPAARWSVMLFATLLTLMVGTLLIPTVNTPTCTRCTPHIQHTIPSRRRQRMPEALHACCFSTVCWCWCCVLRY